MIKDNIKNAKEYYYLGENFQKGFEYLENTDILSLENGKYEIEGEYIFVSVQDYQTKSVEEGKIEAHRKYADIQFIAKGTEKMGVGDIENFKPATFYDDAKDIIFLEGDAEFIEVKSGDFLVFMPQDAHMPCIENNGVSYVKKAVVKVKI